MRENSVPHWVHYRVHHSVPYTNFGHRVSKYSLFRRAKFCAGVTRFFEKATFKDSSYVVKREGRRTRQEP